MWPVSVTHGQAFADNVSRWGEHLAAVGPDGSLTYRQLRGRAERLRKMLANVQVDALLVSSARLGLALELHDLINGPIVEITDVGPQPGATSRAVAARDPSAEVVVVFTSGSTGTPKGTVVSERCSRFAGIGSTRQRLNRRG